MLRFIALAVLLAGAGAGLAYASDASYDQKEQAAPVSKDAGAKPEAARPMTACSCQHARS
jgi:hypothetical protein